ncbi:MAG: Nucleoside-diphosphate-sugar pyrophosphorylase family protein [Actinomycetia bacterium]|nr:Nucleoside-diphosphate-sugar pyrophosphorylase family protein [Actinomycetes bacterium]
MKAVVLVGGEGTRLRPLTYSTPKPLLPIGNQPFLERQLEWLAGYGVDEVVLAIGYLPDAFDQHFPEHEYAGVKLRYRVESEPLGTAGAIRFAAEGIDERIVVCNGDVLTTLDLGELVAFHEKTGADASIALTHVDEPSAFGVVPTFPDGEVRGFVEKPPRGKAPTKWINAGTYVLEPSVLAAVPPRLQVSIERTTFPRMLDRRGRMYAVQSDAYWIDIGTPGKYLEAHTDLLAGKIGAPPAPGAVETGPGVWVQGDVDVHADAQLFAPLLLGAGCVIEAGAVVRGSSIGAGAHVEAGAEVVRSVVLDGATVGPDVRLLDSVLGADARIGVGGSATNETVIGADSVIAAGSLLSNARVPAEG